MKNAVIYARYSSDKQTEQSINGQLRYCKEYAKNHGYNIVNTYIDRAMSGTNDNRPDFQKMIADSAKKQFEFIIVWKLDRFARNRYDSAIYKNKLKKNGVRVLSATEGIGEGDESILLEAMLEAMAETYSRQLSQNVKRGLRESALKAQHIGGHIPLGYKIEGGTVINGKRKGGKIVIDDKNAETVKLIFEKYASGISQVNIVKYLNARGLKTANNAKFTKSSLSSILTNRRYYGLYIYDDILLENAVPAIISKELFDVCQARRAAYRIAPASKRDVNYLLTGKLFCGHCGSPMAGSSGTSRNGSRYYYYRCNRKNNADCDKKIEQKEPLEQYVVDQTLKYILSSDRLYFIAENVVAKYNEDFSVNKIKAVENEINHIKKEIEYLTDKLLLAKSKSIISNINDRAVGLEMQLQDKENDLAGLKIGQKATLKVDEVILWLEEFCEGNSADKAFQAKIIDVLVNSIYLYDDKIVIYYNVKDKEKITYAENLKNLEEYKGSGEFSESSFFDYLTPPRHAKRAFLFASLYFVYIYKC